MKLDPLVNQLVRFRLYESPETFEATILAFDEIGYWVRGGSLCEYLAHSGDPQESKDGPHYLEIKRIRSIQKV